LKLRRKSIKAFAEVATKAISFGHIGYFFKHLLVFTILLKSLEDIYKHVNI